LLCYLICCQVTPIQKQVSYSNAQASTSAKRIVPAWIDTNFTAFERDRIQAGIDEWNLAATAALEIRIMSWHFDMDIKDIVLARNSKGFIILRIDSTSKFAQDDRNKGTLAFANALGGYLIYLIWDRLNYDDIKSVTVHEIAHIFGVPHGGYGLMHTPYQVSKQHCIDEYTAKKAEEFMLLERNSIRYCTP
jgi:hypothetical protein